MRFPWTRLVDAVVAALGRSQDPAPLPRDAADALERGSADVDEYHQTGGGVAPDKAPRIFPEGEDDTI